VSIIRSLGTQSVRAKRLISLSRIYLQDPPSPFDLRVSNSSIPTAISSSSFKPSSMSSSQPINFAPTVPSKRHRYPPTPISHLPGTGTYALDSYRIFCVACQDPSSEEWKSVMPSDKELVRYLVCTLRSIILLFVLCNHDVLIFYTHTPHI
jgi:methyl-CpG-binding domain protein 4